MASTEKIRTTKTWFTRVQHSFGTVLRIGFERGCVYSLVDRDHDRVICEIVSFIFILIKKIVCSWDSFWNVFIGRLVGWIGWFFSHTARICLSFTIFVWKMSKLSNSFGRHFYVYKLPTTIDLFLVEHFCEKVRIISCVRDFVITH